MQKVLTSNKVFLVPVFGIFTYALLYFLATLYYPGGSDFNKFAPGFSWKHNYWCELLAERAQNGMPNTARLLAISAMATLALSLSFFWYCFSKAFPGVKSRIACWAGILSMATGLFLLSNAHDLVINIAGIFGASALILAILILYHRKFYWFAHAGVLCLCLCLLNNFVYYTGYGFPNLPVIQRISFAIFLCWFATLSIKMYKLQAVS